MKKARKPMEVKYLQVDKFPLNPDTLALIDFIRNGGEIPPIKIQKGRDGYRVKNGRHRVTAYKLLGIQFIECFMKI